MIPFDTLKQRLEGDLYRDRFSRHLLATDGSIFSQVPSAVAYPRHTADVVDIIRFAGRHKVPLHPRGAGSGVCGAAVGRGIVVDFTKYMNRLVRLDTAGRRFECQPGFRMGELNQALKGTGLFFPPDPSSGEYASFGGMYATNASGSRSVKYGNVGDYCLDAEIVTAAGDIMTLSEIAECPEKDLPGPLRALHALYTENREDIESAYPPVRYNSTGYNLRGLVTDRGRLTLARLFAGAEGTLGMVTRLTFRLKEKCPHDILVVAYFDDIVQSARATQEILPLNPNSIEVMDKSLLDLARKGDPGLDAALPKGLDNLLLIAFDESSSDACREKAAAVEILLRRNRYSDRIHIAFSDHEKAGFWQIRKAAVPILYKMRGAKKVLALIEDATVPTDQLVPYFKGIYRILDELDVRFVLFGHISKGLLHTRPMLNLKNREDIARLKTVSDRIFDLVRSLGGAISGEHGDGRLRSVYIREQYPDIFHLFQAVKDLFDPAHLLNPDILTGAVPDNSAGERNGQYRFASLRYGEDYRAAAPYRPVLFDSNAMTAEIEKCHGCAKCTTVTHATRMCPVYKELRDEAAAPKAKANILRHLISGSAFLPDRDAFSQGVFHVLDHCINCGSCSHECPSEVDIPRMVMEARASFRRKFGIPLTDRLLTSVARSAKLTRPFSGIAGPALRNRPLRRLLEKATGISADRHLDRFAPAPLSNGTMETRHTKKGRVIYFAGCYATHIKPGIGRAASAVLNAAGFDVVIPGQDCCGLPMYSKGMTDKAGAAIAGNLSSWHHQIRSADHIVTTCSSCLYALSQYWTWDLPGAAFRPAALEISEKLIHISALVSRHMDRLNLTPRELSAAYHSPCHLKATPFSKSSAQMLAGLPGLSLDLLATHCCGMAGTWGMLAKNHDLSRRIGSDLEQNLARSGSDIGITDCPTCRMQMEGVSPKPVLHPIELLHRFLGSENPSGSVTPL